jgi:AcrR family transcriptional regulator
MLDTFGMSNVLQYAQSMTPSSQKSRREESADATRQALLETARLLFTDGGYHATGIEDIARESRVTRGALYHHFRDKKSMFDALVVQLQQDVAAKVSQAAESEPQVLRKLNVGCAEFLNRCSEASYRRLVIEEASSILGTRRCAEIESQTSIGLLTSAIVALKRARLIDVPNAELAARMLARMICEAALLLGESKQPAQLKRDAVVTLERVLRSLQV